MTAFPSGNLAEQRSIRRRGIQPWRVALLALALAALQSSFATAGDATHGIAMHGRPSLPPGFPHLPHVNPDAPKGGMLRLGVTGSYDNLNPFTIKGNTPQGLREYVFESLLGRSSSEPFTLYGLIAASVETPPDRSSVTFRLRAQARFSNGKPITSADVVFTHRLLAEKGWPFQRSHYGKVARVETDGPHLVRFFFKAGGDRELPLILGLMPIMSQQATNPETIERTSLDPPVGSGPYRITSINPGRSITYQRDKDYWGRDLPLMRGRHNFDEITYEYFRDASTMFEAFKSGDLDVRVEDDPTRWASAYDFPAMRQGLAQRREMTTELPAGMSALVFNSRRQPFDDVRVRRALIHLFDAEWINRSLYHGLYRRSESFFSRSMLSSARRPADVRERALLAPFPTAVKLAVMDGLPHLPTTDSSGRERSNIKEAHRLLADAGYALSGNRMVQQTTRRPLALEFLASNRNQERLVLAYSENLKRLGITLRLRQVDTAQYWSRMKSYDFDMAQWNWAASLSPGNEQLNRWSSRAAANQGTFNYAGVKSTAADAMIDVLLQAETQEGFVSAVRALDRVLLSGDYVIPLFHAPAQWLAWRSRLAFPEKASLSGIDLDTWWQTAPAR